MSATGRSDVRQEHDFYPTPTYAVRRLLERWNPPGTEWLDPCAGEGDLIHAAKLARPDVSFGAIELRAECAPALQKMQEGGLLKAFTICDFIEAAPQIYDHAVDVAILNPPFSFAEQFIEICSRIAKRSAILLRINAIRGDGRHKLMDRLKPGLLVLPDRPSFTGWGTDATEYAWFLIGDPDFSGRWELLGETSSEEKKLWNREAKERFPHLKPSKRAA